MGRTLRILAIIVVLLFVIPLAAVAAFYLFFDPNDYREQIAGYVEDQTGRSMSIDGDLGVTFFPWLGITVDDVSLANAEGFEPDNMAEIEQAVLRIQLLPLLRRELNLDTARLDGLDLHLARDEEGRTNWDDIVERLEQAPDEAPSEAPDEPRDDQGLDWQLAGVEARDARIVWEDATVPARYVISDAHLSAGAVGLGEATDLELAFHLESDQPELSGPVELTGELAIAPDFATASASDLELAAKLSGEGVPGGEFDGRLAIPTLEWHGDEERLRIPDLTVNAYGIEAAAEVTGERLAEAPRFAGQLTIQPFNARELMTSLDLEPPETADPDALSRIAFTTAFEGSTTDAAMEDLELTLDDTQLTGGAEISNLDATPHYGFELTAGELDLDRYLPPEGDEESGETENGQDEGAPDTGEAETPDLAALQNLRADGEVTVERLKGGGLTLEDIAVTVSAEDGRIDLEPVSARLYEGELAAAGAVDAREADPVLEADAELAGIQIGPLVADLMDEEWLTGRGDLTFDISATGLTPDQLTRTLNGNAAVHLEDGTVRGLNIPHLVRDARAILAQEERPDSADDQATDFAELTATAEITDGVVRNEDLALRSPLLRANGTGEADLPASELDYLLEVRLVESMEGQGAEDGDGDGITIPIRIRGSFADLRIRPELEDALRERAREELDEEVEELRSRGEEEREEIEERLEEELKGRIRGLFE